MSEFKLQIVTPYGLLFDGNAQKIILRTTEGDIGILPHHIDYVAPLSTGIARIFTADGERIGACSGGMVTVSGGEVRVLSETFEWAENIDAARAQKAKEKALSQIEGVKRGDYEYRLAEVKLKKALIRLDASSRRG